MNIEAIDYLQSAKIFTYSFLAFFIAFWWAPYLISLLRWLKFWKKKSRTVATTGEELVVTKQFYKENEKDRLLPRAGGVLIWVTTLGFAAFFWLILKIFPSDMSRFLNFVSQSETFIPLGTLFFGSMLGLIDDAMVTMENGGNYNAGGLHLNHRLLFVGTLSLLISLWFHFRISLHTLSLFGWEIDLQSLELPGGINGGWLIIPITIIVLVGSWGTRIIDGFDGLAAGVFIPIMLCFAALAFVRDFYDIATLLMVMAGTTTAYLWFNIPPAKFIMGDTGTDGILITLGVIAILIDFVYILPIAGIMLFLTVASASIQVFSKKTFKRKVFLAAPLHHHFEALGWERNQITMRYWLISIMASVLGVAVGLIFG